MYDTITPWSKEAENYFRRLVKQKVIYTDDIHFTRTLGRKYPELFDENIGVMDIGRIEKRNKSMIAIRPGITIVPIKQENWRKRRYTPFKFFKL